VRFNVMRSIRDLWFYLYVGVVGGGWDKTLPTNQNDGALLWKKTATEGQYAEFRK